MGICIKLFIYFQTNEMFANELLLEQVPVSKYAPQTYDAVWAIALALTNAELEWSAANTTVGHFDYSRRDMATEFLQQLGQLSFLGISVSTPSRKVQNRVLIT